MCARIPSSSVPISASRPPEPRTSPPPPQRPAAAMLEVTAIVASLAHLRGETGLTLLLVEQNASTALYVADRAVVLNLGRKVEDDRADNLAADDRVRHAYLGM